MQLGIASRSSPVGAAKTWDGVAGGKYALINTIPEWNKFYDLLCANRHVACDTETTGLNPLTAQIVGFSFSWSAEHSYYIPIRHTRLVQGPNFDPKKPIWIEKDTDEKQLDSSMVLGELKKFFEDPNITTIWHHAKFDLHFLYNEGITPKGVLHDTMLMHNLINENSKHALKNLAVELIHKNADKWEKIVDDWRAKFARAHKKPKSKIHYGFLPFELVVPYAASDAHYTWALYKRFLPMIASNKALRNLYIQIESKLLWVLLDMERQGACVDCEYLLQESPKMGLEMKSLEKKIKAELGTEVNINSTKQIIPILHKKGIKWAKKSKKTQQPSLDREVLTKLAPKYPVCQYLLDYRNLKKQKSTYVDSLAEKAELDDKVHCKYNQNVSTGRMSGSDPNLMNIPGNSDTTRSAFVPPIRHHCAYCGWEEDRVIALPKCPKCGTSADFDVCGDYFMLFVDYSQVEVRMTAHYCLHKNMNIRLSDGRSIEIGRLVNQKISTEVDSFDFNLGCVVSQPVVNYWRNNKPVDESIFRAGTDEWLVIRHEGSPHRKLVLTPQHEVFDPSGNKLLAKDLKVGDELLFREPELTGANVQIFLGSMLGDGNFKFSKSTKTDDPVDNLPSANFYHGEDQTDYFQWKVDRLTSFMTDQSKPDHMNRAHVKSSFQIKKWADLMMVNGVKTPTKEVIGYLDVLGLAVWYMDDGNLSRDKRCSEDRGWNATINNVRMTQEVVNAVNHKFELDFSLVKKGLAVSGDRLDKFFALIHKFIPTCMDYKLPPRWRGRYEERKTMSTVIGVVPVRVIEVRNAVLGEPLFKRNLTQASFDIEVQRTHNYFAQNVLVSNSCDPILLEVYNVTHEDIHTRTMCELFGKYEYHEAVAILNDPHHSKHKEIKRERKVAKMVNFLIIYGGGAKNLAVQISSQEHIYTEVECKTFISTYFQRFRGVERWINRAKKQAMEDRKLQNHFGRYRRLPELFDCQRRMMLGSERWKIERALRQGVNYLIQGTCADLFKIALVRVAQLLEQSRSRIVMPIHDEIVIYMHKQDINLLPDIVREMEDFDFRVPITTSLAYSTTNWNEKQELILS
jgi:DNA polymerase I-like protein with 3'-5' exonuclease and polymerase domains